MKQDNEDILPDKEEPITDVFFRPYAGQTVYEYDFITHEIHEVKQENKVKPSRGTGIIVKVRENCAYAEGINKKNALKKVENLYGGLKLKCINL